MGTLRDKINNAEDALVASTGYDKISLGRMTAEDQQVERETYVRDLLTDLHHYCDHHGLDYDELTTSDLHYEAEKGHDLDEEIIA